MTAKEKSYSLKPKRFSKNVPPTETRPLCCTASAALLVPVFASVAEKMGMPKEVMVLIIGIGASCAFMLPVATPPNAIVFGTGLVTQKDMLKAGMLLNILCIAAVSLWAYFFLL